MTQTFDYIVVNIVTKEIVHEFECENGELAMMTLHMFNDDCRLYTAGALNKDRD